MHRSWMTSCVPFRPTFLILWTHIFKQITEIITALHQTKQRDFTSNTEGNTSDEQKRLTKAENVFHHRSVNWTAVVLVITKITILYRLIWRCQAHCENKPEVHRVCASAVLAFKAEQTHAYNFCSLQQLALPLK